MLRARSVPTYRSRLVIRHAPVIFAIASLLPVSVGAASADERQRAEVKGRFTADGWIEARRIRLRDPDRGSKIEGAVLSIDVTRRRLTIGGFTVVLKTDASIQRDDTSPAVLESMQVGDVVEAKGEWSARQLDASRLRIRPSRSPGQPAGDEVEIEADIEWTDADHFKVLGHPVGLADGGKLTDERTAVRGAELASTSDVPGDRLRRDEDDQHVQPLRVGNWLTLGGRVGGDVWNQQQLVEDPEARDRYDQANAVAQLLGSVTLGKHVELYTKIGASHAFVLHPSGAATADQSELRVYEAYVAFGQESPVGFQAGRQRFRDGREWFFDDYLDAVRLHLRMGTWRAEMTFADGVFAGPRELRSRTGQRHAIASLTKQFGKRSDAAAFLVARDDRNRRERPVWIGGEWNGRIASDVKSWAVGAVRRGESDSGRLGGWAVDAGVAGRLPLSGKPFLTFGYATATGDPSGSDGVDTRFRQTGLDDNSARVFGVKRFARYGFVLEPELSNLTVFTLGGGIRPLERTSVDLVYHRYSQRVARRSLPSNRLDATGTGQSTQMGDELDLIVGVQQWRRIDLSVIVGAFRPGTAVTLPERTMLYWKPEFRIFF